MCAISLIKPIIILKYFLFESKSIMGAFKKKKKKQKIAT